MLPQDVSRVEGVDVMEAQNDQDRRAAENQAMFREVNERIEELNEQFVAASPLRSWACECADVTCVARIEMTLDEYEQLRAHPTCFAVLPSDDHVFAFVERVVERGSGRRVRRTAAGRSGGFFAF